MADRAAPALRPSERQTLLRVATCGSVDDGKSTLIGRLLLDAGLVSDDHLDTLARDSRGRASTSPEGLDLSLLVDGLLAEREGGITIDVAYRYVTLGARSYILADSPGHEQYTRNMATAASNAEAAILIVDARRGVSVQTRRHARILALFGVRHVALVVNKMDLIPDGEATFAAIREEFGAYGAKIGLAQPALIPVSALDGDNVVRRSARMGWHRGPTLLDWLGGVSAEPRRSSGRFRMPVQWVNRPHMDFRGYAGTVASGAVRVGDAVALADPASRPIRVARILGTAGERQEARAGDAVTLVLEGEVDIGRGDVLADPERRPAFARAFTAEVVWFGEAPLVPGRSCLMRLGTAIVPVTLEEIRYRLDIDSLAQAPAGALETNDIGLCALAAERPLAFETFREDAELGAFILIDRADGATLGCGLVAAVPQRATNVTWQLFDTDRARRAALKRQRPLIAWLTGLSGAGKSTIANLAEGALSAAGLHTYVLDGDNVRHGLCGDLGYSEADRAENVRRVAQVARLMADAGLVVIVALISPFRRDRDAAREVAGDIPFLEVFVDTPVAVCADRDPKGLYARAMSGEIANFTGVSSPYEPPAAPDLVISTAAHAAEEDGRALASFIAERARPGGAA